MSFESLREEVSEWLATCETCDGSSFVMSRHATEPTLMTLSFAILVLELFDLLPDARSNDWIRRLRIAQDPDTGLFIDPRLKAADLKASGRSLDYVIHQTTYFAAAALDALHKKPRHRLGFALKLAREADVADWLEALDWSEPWVASNWVMFIATALFAEWQWYGEQAAADAIHSVLDWLDERQNPETGFWGVTSETPLSHAMAATYHFLPYYFCLGRELGYVAEMIDSTLALQQEDGLFHPDGGGDTCLDVDAVDILVKCSLLTDHRADEVRIALDRAYSGLLANQAEDGGFCGARNRPLPPKTWKRRVAETLHLDRLLGRPYAPPKTVWHYSGWQAMPFDVRQADLWSTWFRPFGLALISARYPDQYPWANRWRFRRLPALGWHDTPPASKQAARERSWNRRIP
ncbi:MAG: hypothetical protein U9R72_13855 [Chloroflexota bacterium]|nr:hypothetical protein [Chloroflexota bacterium]